MAPRDLPDERQAESGPPVGAGPRGVEAHPAVEDAFAVGRGDARPVVVDVEDRVVAAAERGDPHLRGVPLGVAPQVVDEAPKGSRVAVHLDRLAVGTGEGPQVDRHERQPGAALHPGQGQQVVDQPAETPDVLAQLVEQVRQDHQLRMGLGDVELHADPGQRRPQLVGRVRDEGLLLVDQGAQGPEQRVEGPAEPGDLVVARRGRQGRGHPRRVAGHRLGCPPEPFDRAECQTRDHVHEPRGREDEHRHDDHEHQPQRAERPPDVPQRRRDHDLHRPAVEGRRLHPDPERHPRVGDRLVRHHGPAREALQRHERLHPAGRRAGGSDGPVLRQHLRQQRRAGRERKGGGQLAGGEQRADRVRGQPGLVVEVVDPACGEDRGDGHRGDDQRDGERHGRGQDQPGPEAAPGPPAGEPARHPAATR